MTTISSVSVDNTVSAVSGSTMNKSDQEIDNELLQYLITGVNVSFKPYNDTPAEELKRIFRFGQNIDLYKDVYGFRQELFAEYMNIFCYTYCGEIIKMYARLNYDTELFCAQIFMLFPETARNKCDELFHLTRLCVLYSLEKNEAFFVAEDMLNKLTDSIVGGYKMVLKIME